MFYLCQSLITLNLSNFDISKITVLTCLFEGYASLTSIDISSFDT